VPQFALLNVPHPPPSHEITIYMRLENYAPQWPCIYKGLETRRHLGANFWQFSSSSPTHCEHWEMMMKISLLSVALISAFCVVQGQVQLSLIHFNDFHARYEPTSGGGGSCKPGENEQGAYAFDYRIVRLMAYFCFWDLALTVLLVLENAVWK